MATAHPYFYDTLNSERDRIMKVPNEISVGFIHQYLKPGFRVLDLGCGAGRHALDVANRGMSVVPKDLTKVGLDYIDEQARLHKLDVKTILRDMHETPFPTASFDCVFAWGSIFHTTRAKIQGIIDDCHRLVKPGGYFYVTFKALEDFQNGLGTKIQEGTYWLSGQSLMSDMVMHFACCEEVRDVLRAFEVLTIEGASVTNGNGTKRFMQHVATTRRP